MAAAFVQISGDEEATDEQWLAEPEEGGKEAAWGIGGIESEHPEDAWPADDNDGDFAAESGCWDMQSAFGSLPCIVSLFFFASHVM